MLRLATPDDVARLGRTMHRAFESDPVLRWLFPDDDDYAVAGLEACRRNLASFVAGNLTWCSDDGVCFAAWAAPGRPDVPGTTDAPQAPVPELRLARVKSLRAHMAANMPPVDHWYLSIVATHPDWQQQGLASSLLNMMFAMHDQLGVAYYLETERPELVAFYHHHGFVVRSEWDLDEGGPHMWGMLREPPVA